MTVKRELELIVQIKHFAPEFRAGFLLARGDTFQCVLGLQICVKNNCVLFSKELLHFRGKIRRVLLMTS